MEPEEREERGSGRSQNVVHTLPRSMASVPRFLTGPLERVDPAAGATQLLVLTSDPESSVAIAEAVLELTGPAGIELLPVTSARRASRLIAGRPVLAVAGAPRDIRDLVRGSHLKLDSVTSVVLAWADEILAGNPDDIEALEAVMSELPKDAARIVVTSRSEGRVNAFAERYLRRAHRDAPAGDEAEGTPIPLQYVTVTRGTRVTALRRLFDDMDPPSAVVLANSDDVAETVRDERVVIEAQHRVRLGQRGGQLGTVPLGETAHRHHGTRPLALLEVGGGEQRVDAVLLGSFDESAGVDQHHVGLPGLGGEAPAIRRQPPGQFLRVDLVARTAERHNRHRTTGVTRSPGCGLHAGHATAAHRPCRRSG